MQENGVKKDTKFKPGNDAGKGRPKGSVNKNTTVKNTVQGIMDKISAGELTLQSWEDVEKYTYTVLAYDGLSDKNPKIRLKVALALLPFMKAAKDGDKDNAGAKGLQINLFAPQVPDNPFLDKSKKVEVIPILTSPKTEDKKNAAVNNKG